MSEIGKKIDVIIMPEEANTLLAFRKHREKFIELMQAGVFDLESGRAEIDVHNGQIQTVHIDRMTFKRGRGSMEGRGS